MKNALAFSLAVIAIATCFWQASVSEDVGSRLIFAACAAFVALAVGVGIGERAHTAFSRTLVRVNKLLGEQNRDLCEMNARLLRRELRKRFRDERQEGAESRSAAS